MRTSFWDIVGTQGNLKQEMQYIESSLYHSLFYIDYQAYSLVEYIDRFYFSSWAAKNKITCPSIEKLRLKLKINEFVCASSIKIDDFLLTNRIRFAKIVLYFII